MVDDKECKNLEELFEQYRIQERNRGLDMLKELYTDNFGHLIFKDNPVLKLIKKEDFTGQSIPIPIIID